MLLRSSSTPVLGSLASSDSPSNFNHNKPPSSDSFIRLAFHAAHQKYHSSCNSSPISRSMFPENDSESKSNAGGFRRAHSDGNLETLAALEVEADEFHDSTLARFSEGHLSPLQAIPSFSVYNSVNEEAEVEVGGGDDKIGGDFAMGEHLASTAADFTFSHDKLLDVFENCATEVPEEILSIGGITTSPLVLAGGAGFEVGDLGLALKNGGLDDGIDFPRGGSNVEQNESEVEDYYKRMVEEHPGSALFLRNYAQLLHQKKDFEGAEEYYSRAILAQPGEGEVLSQYARLIWEFHHDFKRAASYFEQSVQAAPRDSHVLAAYANFLWAADEEEDSES